MVMVVGRARLGLTTRQRRGGRRRQRGGQPSSATEVGSAIELAEGSGQCVQRVLVRAEAPRQGRGGGRARSCCASCRRQGVQKKKQGQRTKAQQKRNGCCNSSRTSETGGDGKEYKLASDVKDGVDAGWGRVVLGRGRLFLYSQREGGEAAAAAAAAEAEAGKDSYARGPGAGGCAGKQLSSSSSSDERSG